MIAASKYQYLFWDLDHTLWDFEKNSGITLAQLYHTYNLAAMGISAFEPFRSAYEYHNEMLWQQLIAGNIDRVTLRWKRMALVLGEYGIDDLHLAYEMSEAYLQLLPKQGELIAHAANVLHYCKDKGYKMFVLTNGFEKTQIEKIRTANIGHFFEGIYTADHAQSMKPHAPIFKYALAQSKAELHNSIMIGDSLQADVIGAKEINMDQIWYNPLAIVTDTQPTHEIQSLHEIMDIL